MSHGQGQQHPVALVAPGLGLCLSPHRAPHPSRCCYFRCPHCTEPSAPGPHLLPRNTPPRLGSWGRGPSLEFSPAPAHKTVPTTDRVLRGPRCVQSPGEARTRGSRQDCDMTKDKEETTPQRHQPHFMTPSFGPCSDPHTHLVLFYFLSF